MIKAYNDNRTDIQVELASMSVADRLAKEAEDALEDAFEDAVDEIVYDFKHPIDGRS